ncbi:unnamed protein product [Didymodactylos carnosus]|uniref:RNase H type-1 domain-containing protein n=1 Tax=Didymodactylos carnosus TaxID=1234261 RepID=A0A814WM44_9BILA|nr:unnamed protein product [Didymodactylos carnosus]CAF1261838.1 unnamed protein product [Didymodactylos carnosus]CAF3968620.1 unnamed protein product [Didymodactylos carnosus]CAF4068388.1 unnamed protein product [Didymodactylos carnosus]
MKHLIKTKPVIEQSKGLTPITTQPKPIQREEADQNATCLPSVSLLSNQHLQYVDKPKDTLPSLLQVPLKNDKPLEILSISQKILVSTVLPPINDQQSVRPLDYKLPSAGYAVEQKTNYQYEAPQPVQRWNTWEDQRPLVSALPYDEKNSYYETGKAARRRRARARKRQRQKLTRIAPIQFNVQVYFCDASYNDNYEVGVYGFMFRNQIVTQIYTNGCGSTMCEVLAATLALQHANKCYNGYDNSYYVIIYTDNTTVQSLINTPKMTDRSNYPEFFEIKDEYNYQLEAQWTPGHPKWIQNSVQRAFAKLDQQVRFDLRQYVRMLEFQYDYTYH